MVFVPGDGCRAICLAMWWGSAVIGYWALVGGVVCKAGSWFSWLGVCWVYGRLVDGLWLVVLGRLLKVVKWEAQRCAVMAWSLFVFGVRCGLMVAALVAGLAGCMVMCIFGWLRHGWV